MITLVLLACRPQGAVLVFDPPSASLAGYELLTVDLGGTDLTAADVAEVTIGGIRAWDLVPDGDDHLALRNQGAPRSGPQEVVVRTVQGEEHVFPDAFSYQPSLDPRFERFVAFGASLTQGVQGGVPVQHGVLNSPPHLVAERLGAYMPLPLLVDPLFPPLGWADIGPPPDCVVPDVVAHVTEAAVEVLGILEDEERDTIGFYNARVDPDLEVQNVAVGDTELHSILYGPPDDFAQLFVVKMVYAPYADLLDPVATSQMELVEGLAPTLVMSTDVYGNDLIQAIVLSDSFDTSELTPPEDLRADLEELVARLAGTGAEVFLANMPRPTILPVTGEKRARALELARAAAVSAGEDPDTAEAAAAAEVDAKLAEIEATGVEYNRILDEVTAAWPSVHVVDFGGRVDELVADGLDVGGEHLTAEKLGGLLSTDGVHFGDVGYGVLAQLFVDAIAAELDVALEPLDLDTLMANDPYSPIAARAAGVDPVDCVE